MPLNGRLTVVQEVDGGWRLALSREGVPVVLGVISAENATILTTLAASLPSEPKEVLTARSHAAWTATETGLGRCLAGALCEQSDLWGGLLELIGEALTRGDEVLLAVEADGVGPRELPWELLHLSAEGHLLSGVRPVTIARLHPAVAALPPSSGQRLRVVLWAPEAADEGVEHLVGIRQELAEELGVSWVVVGADGEAPPARTLGEVDVLHIIGGGGALAAQLRALASGVPLGPGEAAAVLLEAARASALTLLEVGEGAGIDAELIVAATEALVRAGVPAVVAPVRPVGSVSLDAFVRPLLGALHRGESLARAARSGHAAVSALGLAHPANRWWIMRLVLGRMDAAGPRVRRSIWPDELPLPGADVLVLLEGAATLARSSGHGFVGLEHLALALDESVATTPLSRRALDLLAPQRPELRGQLLALTASSEVPDRLPLTPRLMRLGRQLPAGFDLDSFWRALALERFSPLLGMARLEPPVASDAPTVSMEPPDRIEVVGGPEDGRVLPLMLNSLIGRWHAGPDTSGAGLYQGTPLTDARLSRDAVRWIGPGRVLLKRQASRRRMGRTLPVGPGEVVVAEGDVLVLTAATRVGFFKAMD